MIVAVKYLSGNSNICVISSWGIPGSWYDTDFLNCILGLYSIVFSKWILLLTFLFWKTFLTLCWELGEEWPCCCWQVRVGMNSLSACWRSCVGRVTCSWWSWKFSLHAKPLCTSPWCGIVGCLVTAPHMASSDTMEVSATNRRDGKERFHHSWARVEVWASRLDLCWGKEAWGQFFSAVWLELGSYCWNTFCFSRCSLSWSFG